MEKIRSLADQIRDELAKPSAKQAVKKGSAIDSGQSREPAKKSEYEILKKILAFDTSQNKSMVHARFDARTADTMNKFKMAANVDVSRLIAYAVKHLFETCPELKKIIKDYIQNTDL
jgi:ribosomal protein L21E